MAGQQGRCGGVFRRTSHGAAEAYTPMNDSNPIEAPPLIRQSPKRVWLYILPVVALLAVLSTLFAVRSFFLSPSRSSQAARAATIVASFQADFQPEQPRPGWHYYWNDNGPVGNTNAYAELHWIGNHYVPADPVPPSGRYLQLSNRSSHPGQGPAQNIRDDNEHAVVIAFTLAKAGRYAIQDSFIARNDGPAGGAVHLRVF